MIQIRKSDERFHTRIDWLDSRHTFSFGEHHDPAHMGFRALRVINEDRIEPGRGFGTHPHRDMEILTYVVDGAIEHRDSMGNGSVIRPGDVQRMSAGTGVLHSEHSPAGDSATHLLQIWIEPQTRGLEPSYEQRQFPDAQRRNTLRLVASRDGRDGSVTLHRHADIYVSSLDTDASVQHDLAEGRHAWVQVIGGAVEVDGAALGAGDGASVSDPGSITITAPEPAELILFDLD